MSNKILLNALGTPELLSADGSQLASKTRRATALIGYLARKDDHTESRQALASMLWSDSEWEKSSGSLRQTLSHIRDTEKAAGFSFIEASRSSIRLKPDFVFSDLDQIRTSLDGKLSPSNNEAIRLWKGDFLEGFEDIDDAFSEWLLNEREVIQQEFETAAVKAISDESAQYSEDHIEATASFLLWIDPSDEFAHATLIRLYTSQGRSEKAEAQYKSCVKEMTAALGREPSEETRSLLKTPASKTETISKPVRTEKVSDKIRFPTILISNNGIEGDTDTRALSVRDGIVSGLSSLRSFELHEASSIDIHQANAPILMNSGLQQYALRFRHDPIMDCLTVSLENKGDGLVIFQERMDLSSDADRKRILDSIQLMTSRIHDQVSTDAKLHHPDTPFALWRVAEDLLWQYDLNADRQALELIDKIEHRHSDFSLTYSARSSIMLKHLNHYPKLDGGLPDLKEIQLESQKSIDLDPWHSQNRRMFGWSQIGLENWDDARSTFMIALNLSPLDPMNMISVAKGLAVAGDTDTAMRYADKTLSNMTVVPKVVYDYLGNIHFAAGNFDKAATFLEKSPEHSISSLITRAAALNSTGQTEELEKTLKVLSRTGHRSFGTEILGQPDLIYNWLAQRHGFANPLATHSFKAILRMAAERMTRPTD